MRKGIGLIILKNQHWKIVGALSAVLLIMCFTNISMQKKAADMSVEVNATIAPSKKAYLTFDDGPSKSTDRILDILARNNIKATFFVVGKDDQISKWRYKRIVAEGHTLAMHTYTHDYKKVYKNLDGFKDDLMKLSDLLYNTTGIRPTVYRMPGGSSNTICSKALKEEIFAFLDKENITYYDWNADSSDSLDKSIPPSKLNQKILKDVGSNDAIILMHDLPNLSNTVEALQDLIDELKKLDYQLLPIDEGTKVVQHVKSSKLTTSK